MASQPIFFVPMAGQGARFKQAGIATPKQLLPAGARTCLERSLDSFRNLSEFKIVIGVNDDQVAAAATAYVNSNKLDGEVIRTGKTQAPTETLQIMIDRATGLTDDARVYVFTMDVELFPAVTIDTGFSADGVTYVFDSAVPIYSYVKVDAGRVTDVAEKKVISRHANVGLYQFRSFGAFKQALRRCEDDRRASSRETHVSDMIRLMLERSAFRNSRRRGCRCPCFRNAGRI